MTHPSEPETQDEPAQLKFLRRLVTTLTVIMVGGVLVVIALLVIRLSAGQASGPQLPDRIALPEGHSAEAVTFGSDWIAIVARDPEGVGQILLFDAETGDLRQNLKID